MSGYRLKYGQWEVLLKDQDLVVGRGKGCDLRLDDPAISRRHAVFRVENGRLIVTDCSSRNGVYLDGVKVRGPKRVPVGAQLRIGKHQIQVVGHTPGSEDESAEEDESVFTLLEDPRAQRRPAEGSGPATPLSPRERQVVSMMAQGFTQKRAAETMGLSVKTVEGYLRRVREKLGIKTRADLVAYAKVAGIVGVTGNEPGKE